jgi:hypothetical protein
MAEIADASVVSGEVNGDGHLILTTSGGDTSDAGAVVGPTGATGADGTDGTDGTTIDLSALTTANPTTAAWSNNTKKITDVADGTSANDVVNKEQLDTKANLSGATFTGSTAPAVHALSITSNQAAVDMSTGNDQRLTLTGTTTELMNPSNAVDGMSMLLWVKQDATGGRLLTYDTKYKFTASLTSPTLSTGANAIDLLGFIYNASLNSGAGQWVFAAFLAGIA